MERTGPSVADIRIALETNQLVKPVGELTLVKFSQRLANDNLGARTDFYVEPIDTPTLDPDDPEGLGNRYNDILKSMLPGDQFRGFVKLFTFASYLRSSPKELFLGSRLLYTSDTAGTRKTTTETTFSDPRLAAQATLLGEPPIVVKERGMDTEVFVRLFVPGMGQLVYAYERGYYMDGNVVPWDQGEHNNLVWKGKYISMDRLSVEQLRDIAKGEVPFPRLEVLEKNEFEINRRKRNDAKRVQDLMASRLSRREQESYDEMLRPRITPLRAAS